MLSLCALYIYIYIYMCVCVCVFISLRYIVLIMQFNVTIARNCEALTGSMNVSHAACDERINQTLFWSNTFALWIYIMFCYGYMKYGMQYNMVSLKCPIYACYLWDLTSNFSLTISSCNPYLDGCYTDFVTRLFLSALPQDRFCRNIDSVSLLCLEHYCHL
jgi:hypothetical protein